MPMNAQPIAIGSKAEPFSLWSVNHQLQYALPQGKAGTIVAFICNHCPYVQAVLPTFIQIAYDYRPLGIACVTISSNDPIQYPQDDPTQMQKLAKEMNMPFAYCFDEDQTVAKAYQATCTPEFFVYDDLAKLYFHGAFDDYPAHRSPNQVTGFRLKQALNHLIAKKPFEDQSLSQGCSIKWKQT
jgi:thiol-disulfide isomerase/thioredoxin